MRRSKKASKKKAHSAYNQAKKRERMHIAINLKKGKTK